LFKTKNTPCGVFFERKLFGVLLLEGSANSICAGCCVAGTYVDGFCCASGASVVVNAVGNVANNAVVAFAGVFFVFIIHHFSKTPFCEFTSIFARYGGNYTLPYCIYLGFFEFLRRKLCHFLL
jgi:hypothetical protein